MDLKLTELKELCKSLNVPVSGTKAQLVERILEVDTEEEDSSEDLKAAEKPAEKPGPTSKRRTKPSGYIEETEISGPKGKPIISGPLRDKKI